MRSLALGLEWQIVVRMLQERGWQEHMRRLETLSVKQ